MWGQEGFRCGMQGWQRIIPTRVGTRKETQNFVQSAKDHPHACGDKRIKKILKGIAKGSSPRVWGQECVFVILVEYSRIIPTRVGTRTLLYHRTTVTKDHPHACGDKEAREYLKDGVKGSSPRVWGQAESCTAALYSARIIPTRVGTSSN